MSERIEQSRECGERRSEGGDPFRGARMTPLARECFAEWNRRGRADRGSVGRLRREAASAVCAGLALGCVLVAAVAAVALGAVSPEAVSVLALGVGLAGVSYWFFRG